jgi:hypothetical protein
MALAAGTAQLSRFRVERGLKNLSLRDEKDRAVLETISILATTFAIRAAKSSLPMRVIYRQSFGPRRKSPASPVKCHMA